MKLETPLISNKACHVPSNNCISEMSKSWTLPFPNFRRHVLEQWNSSDELLEAMSTKTVFNFKNRTQRSDYRSAVSLRPLVTRKIRPLFGEMTKHTIVCVFCRFTFLRWESERKKTFFVAVISVNIWNFVSRCSTTNIERTKSKKWEMTSKFHNKNEHFSCHENRKVGENREMFNFDRLHTRCSYH